MRSQVKNTTKNNFYLRFKLLFVLTPHHNFSSFELGLFKQVKHDIRTVRIISQSWKILEYSLSLSLSLCEGDREKKIIVPKYAFRRVHKIANSDY